MINHINASNVTCDMCMVLPVHIHLDVTGRYDKSEQDKSEQDKSEQSLKRDLFTISEVCLQFLFSQNFIHQQHEDILKHDNHFQTYCIGKIATYGT